MSVTRKAIVTAAITAAAFGFGAPAASAGTGDDISSGLINVSDNNIGPVQVCNNDVPVNVIGGQVPVSDVAGLLGIGAKGNSAIVSNSCDQDDYQAD